MLRGIHAMKILKWTVIVLSVLLVAVLGIAAWFIWTANARLERQLAAIREAGDPVTLADLARKPIPPETNAATYLRRAEPGVTAISDAIDRSAEARDYFYPPANSPMNGAVTIPMPAKVLRTTRAVFDAHPDVMALLEQAAKCPDYDAELDYRVTGQDFMDRGLSAVQKNRNFARALRFHAYLLASEGRRDDAVQSTVVLLKLARHFDRNPTIVSYLIALACRGMALESANAALQSGPVSKPARDQLDAELALQEPMSGYVWALKSERASAIDQIDALLGGKSMVFVPGGAKYEKSECLDMMQDAITAASQDFAGQDNTKNAPTSRQGIWKGGGRLAQMSFAPLQAGYQATKRTQAMIRCLRVLNALQRHATGGNDKVPKLTDLGLPPATTVDPFTSGPLHAKKTPHGWLVYSVGKNLRDDGGKIEDPENGDVGAGPPPPTKPEKPPAK
jgi:hypothetical protein